jgi:hypothetical protein
MRNPPDNKQMNDNPSSKALNILVTIIVWMFAPLFGAAYLVLYLAPTVAVLWGLWEVGKWALGMFQ